MDCRQFAQHLLGHPETARAVMALVDTEATFEGDNKHFPQSESGGSAKTEHRLFSFVSLNWRGKPLESLEVVVNLIGATTTNTGLKVYARLDDRHYERGVEITDQQLASVNITRHAFHGDWNYTITPSLAQS
jgi:hypothetical protein